MAGGDAMTEDRPARRRVADSGLIVVFLAMICLPVTWNLVGPSPPEVGAEYRPLGPKPALHLRREVLTAFPVRFEAYYNDHFGFRNTLIRWLDTATVRWLKVSTSPKVILGRHGWLFLTEVPVAKVPQETRPFTPAQLAGWQRVLEARRDWLARRGIRYLVVLVPEKQTIYPEELPYVWRR